MNEDWGKWGMVSGHHAFQTGSGAQDNLFTEFEVDTRFVHGITVDGGSNGNVFSGRKGIDLNFDHHQDGKDLSLVIIVGCATAEDTAKELGDNFVRLVKTFGPELAPTRTEIGSGDFDYLVGVYCGNERKIVLGGG